MQLFHASPFKFERFSLDYIGQGDGGDTLGRGLYLSEELKVAERFAHYWRKKSLSAYLYTATLQAANDEVLDLAQSWDRKVDHPRWGRIDYPKMLHELGAARVFEILVAMGIKAVRAHEEDDKGLILLCIQPQHLRIVSCETLE